MAATKPVSETWRRRTRRAPKPEPDAALLALTARLALADVVAEKTTTEGTR